MTHEWKVGDRAIADGFGRNPRYGAVYFENLPVRIESIEHTRTLWIGSVTLTEKCEIHVRNLTPDRRKGEPDRRQPCQCYCRCGRGKDRRVKA